MSVNTRLFKQIIHAVKFYKVLNKNEVELYVLASKISKPLIKKYRTIHARSVLFYVKKQIIGG